MVVNCKKCQKTAGGVEIEKKSFLLIATKHFCVTCSKSAILHLTPLFACITKDLNTIKKTPEWQQWLADYKDCLSWDETPLTIRKL